MTKYKQINIKEPLNNSGDFFSQREMWIRVVGGAGGRGERHGNMDGATSAPNILCVNGPRGCGRCPDCPAHSGKHLHQATQYQQEKKAASTPGRAAAERAPARSRHSRLNARSINSPALAHHAGLLGAFRVKAVPRTIHHSCSHHPFTLSQHILTGLPFTYRRTFLLSGYLQKHRLGLCIHPP